MTLCATRGSGEPHAINFVEFPLVVKSYGITGMSEENGMQIALTGLKIPDCRVALGDGIGPARVFVVRSSAYIFLSESIDPLSARQASRASIAVKVSGSIVSSSSMAECGSVSADASVDVGSR